MRSDSRACLATYQWTTTDSAHTEYPIIYSTLYDYNPRHHCPRCFPKFRQPDFRRVFGSIWRLWDNAELFPCKRPKQRPATRPRTGVVFRLYGPVHQLCGHTLLSACCANISHFSMPVFATFSLLCGEFPRENGAESPVSSPRKSQVAAHI